LGRPPVRTLVRPDEQRPRVHARRASGPVHELAAEVVERAPVLALAVDLELGLARLVLLDRGFEDRAHAASPSCVARCFARTAGVTCSTRAEPFRAST